MNRMSSLPQAQYCGLAPRLGEQFGAGRPAAMSTAFHAMCAGDRSLLHRLTDAERKEVESWQPPPDLAMPPHVLKYAEADKELEVCLDAFGQACEPADAITVGHLDFGWHFGTTAYVGDIKKSRWTAADGTDLLQLHAYGMAYAQLRSCSAYVVGIWLPVDGEWIWTEEPVLLGSAEHARIWGEIRAAALNTSATGSTGPHCSSCYSRTHCPEWSLPAALAPTVLGPIVLGKMPSPEEAGRLVKLLSTYDELADKAKRQLKVWVERGELEVIDGAKKWVPVECKGRESIDREKLEAELGDGAARFVKRGANFEQMRWVKR